MARLSPQAAGLLMAYEDLPRKLKAFVGEAFQERFLDAPEVEVTGSDGERRCGKKGNARTVVITRSDPKQVRVPGDAPGASLVIPVNDRAIAPEQIRLSYLGEDAWLLENSREAGEVRYLKAGPDVLPDVAPGGKCKIHGTSLSFRVRSWRFEFSYKQAQPQPVGSVQVDPGAPLTAANASVTRFRVLDCDFELASPKDFWIGRRNQQMQILGAIWEKFANEFHLRAAGEVGGLAEIPECRVEQQSADSDIFTLRIQLSDGGHEFHFAVPLDFYDAFRSSKAGVSGLAGRVTNEVRWRPVLVVGEQNLLLGQLRKLELHSVLVLKTGAARLLVRDAGFEWKVAAGFQSGRQRFVVVGEKTRTRQSVWNGGFMSVPQTAGALNIDEVPVAVQVVVTLEELNAADLATYVPGKELPLELGENSRVEIAVNGKVLGTGKLVKAPNGRIGVQVLNWDV